MNEVVSYWKNSTQMTAVAIDRMMGYRLVSNRAIVKWVFSSVNVDLFHVSDRPWEVQCLFHFLFSCVFFFCSVFLLFYFEMFRDGADPMMERGHVMFDMFHL